MTNSEAKTRRAIAAELHQKLDQISASDERINQHEAEIAQERELQKPLYAAGSDCYAAARVLKFDLDAELAAYREELARTTYTVEMPNSNPAMVERPVPEALKLLATMPKQPSIKQHALIAAEEAYPAPIRASVIRQQLSAIGIETHEKTVGMTLYRLLKDGYLRRDGWDWFFVPAAERNVTAPPKGQESPGFDPGLLDEAVTNGG